MDDDKLSNLIQKIGHNIDEIRDRSMIMLIQKYEKNIINETHFKKRNYFFDVILRYINDRNCSIPLKNLIHVLTFVHRIIETDEEIKKKFEEFGIYTFTKEFLSHFKKNEEKYKFNNARSKLNDTKGGDKCIKTCDKMQLQNNNNEYNQVGKILIELIRAYNANESEDFLKWDTDERTSMLDVKNATGDENHAIDGCKNVEDDLLGTNTNVDVRKNSQKKNKDEQKSGDIGLNEEGHINDLSLNKNHTLENPTIISSQVGYHTLEKERVNTKNASVQLLNNEDNIIPEKDLMNISQIMKKNNYVNIFTKNNFSKSDDFEYYNSLYSLKNEVNKKSIHLLLTYKMHKANKIREEYAYFNCGSLSIPRVVKNHSNFDERDYIHILNNYTFLYLYNFFDCFDMFKRNFLEINGIEKMDDSIKSDKGKSLNDKSKEEENMYMSYCTYLNNKHVYNKNICYKIKNYINKMNLLHFYLSMKFSYFELLGMNIIKKIISVDDLTYMHKEVNKILNEYIYIFNKDSLLFNYKFLYTLSYNIQYIYKNYVENNQSVNEFHHINNLLNNLSYLIYIIVYSLYISINQKGECLCNSIHSIYLNNFFFLINQNIFYLLLLRKSRKKYNYIGKNQIEKSNESLDHLNELLREREKKNLLSENNINSINNINTFYFKKNEERALRKTGDDNAISHFNENDMYYYLFITKNNCTYIFKVLILFMLEILKISHSKISTIDKSFSILNFHIDHFVIIYDFLYNILLHYFSESDRKINSHLEILIEYIEENNFRGCGNKKSKQNQTQNSNYISKNLTTNKLNNFSSSSSNTSNDLKKNKFENIDMFSNSSYRRTYKYTPKQVEVLKIVCLYINYTPVSFILMKKIQTKLIDLFKFFLFDMHLNTHHIELLYFFKMFFFFYDYEIYKEYNDLVHYFYSLSNIFFVYSNIDREEELGTWSLKNSQNSTSGIIGMSNLSGIRTTNFHSDISTFINTSNNIFHFFFFIPTSYSTLNEILEKYYTSNKTEDISSNQANEIFSNSINANDAVFLQTLEPFKSSDFLDTQSSVKNCTAVDAQNRNENTTSNCIKQFCNILLLHSENGKKKQLNNFTTQESLIVHDNQVKNLPFDSHFIEKITKVVVENNFRMLFNSLFLLTSEYNNFTNYVKSYKEENISMYQFIVDKLSACKNKMYILTFNHHSENKKNIPQNIKFIELFKNFILLLHNLISVIYSYNTEIIFFLFNFIFNINHQKSSLHWENNNLTDNTQFVHYPFSHFQYQMRNGNYKEAMSDQNNLLHNTKLDKYVKNGIISENTHMEHMIYEQNNKMDNNNFHTIINNPGEKNQKEIPKEYLGTQYVTHAFPQRGKNEYDIYLEEERKEKKNLAKDNCQKYSNKNIDQCDQHKYSTLETSQIVLTNLDSNTKVEINNYTNNDLFDPSTFYTNNMNKYSPDFYIPSFLIYEFIDIIYELCVYSKKEIRNYYLFFILENVKKRIELHFDSLKDKDIHEKKMLLSNIKIFSKLLLFLYYIKKKYIMLLEPETYNSFDFLYVNYFSPIILAYYNVSDSNENNADNMKNGTTSKSITNLLYFYKNVFLNVHNLYFLLFQRKKKKRILSLKIMWKLHHQFRIKFTKVENVSKNSVSKCTAINPGETKNDLGIVDLDIYGQNESPLKGKEDHHNHYSYKPAQKKENHQKQYNNTFNFSSDLKFSTNILNIYISHFILNHDLNDEAVIIQTFQNIDINREEFPIHLFDHIMSFILKRNAKFRTSNMHIRKIPVDKKQMKDLHNSDDFLLSIYEKIQILYTKLIKEILAKDQTNTNNIESFTYVLKIIILLLITNCRNSNVCKRIYKEKYFYLSHIFCFFFYENDIIKALSTSLSFYLIFDQNILLLNKHRIFLEPHLLLDCKNRKSEIEMNPEKEENTINLISEEINSPRQSCTNILENSLINEIKVEHIKGYYRDNSNNVHISCSEREDLSNFYGLQKYSTKFFNLYRNRHIGKNKYAQNDEPPNQLDNINKASFHIEKKIIFFLPFWLYKKLHPNNFLLNIKKLKSFFFFSTKYSYLHTFHDSKLNQKEKELCFYGNYSSDNIFRSFFLFVNKYYYLSKSLCSKPFDSTTHSIHHKSGSTTIFNQRRGSNEKSETITFPIANINSFLFLNTTLNTKYILGKGSSYIDKLLQVLKILPPLNDCTDNEINFPYIYNLNELFSYLNNCYMQLLYTEKDHSHFTHEKNQEHHYNQKDREQFSKQCDKQLDQQFSHKHSKQFHDGKESKQNVINTSSGNIPNKHIYSLLQNDYDEIVNIINLVYSTVFPYLNKLLFFMYNQLTVNRKEENYANCESTQIGLNRSVHANLILLKHFLAIFDICLYIHLILQKKTHIKEKIYKLDENIDLSLFVYKLLYTSVTTTTLKNKISCFALNIIYNFLDLDNYYIRIKNSFHDNYIDCSNKFNFMDPLKNFIDLDDDTNCDVPDEERRNPMLLKEERRIRSKKTERSKNFSILVNFLFFILSKYTKKKKKNKRETISENKISTNDNLSGKRSANPSGNNIYSNLINVYEIEKTINVENVTFQNQEEDYLKLDIYFLKNILCMLHVIMRKGYFFDMHLVNHDISYINMDILIHHDYTIFIHGAKVERVPENSQKKDSQDNEKAKCEVNSSSGTELHSNNNLNISMHKRNYNNCITERDVRRISPNFEDNNARSSFKRTRNLHTFKHVFLNRYVNILTKFCNIYNDIIIECLHIQLLLLFFKYTLQVLKYEISKEHFIKSSHYSKQQILVHFLKYYKADKQICKFVKNIYFIILKYAIYIQNIRICNDFLPPFKTDNRISKGSNGDTNKEQQNTLNKHNYFLREEDAYKNYCQLFYKYSISKYKNCMNVDQDETYDHPSNYYFNKEDDLIKGQISKYQQNKMANPNYVSMIDIYCTHCEEIKILFLSIVLFLSFSLDNFPFFFCLNGNEKHPHDEKKNQENNQKDNISILCEQIFYYLSRKNIYINFRTLKEAKILEKYFIKIFIKLLFCDEREAMNNLQKYEIYFYKNKIEWPPQDDYPSRTSTSTSDTTLHQNNSVNYNNSKHVDTKYTSSRINIPQKHMHKTDMATKKPNDITNSSISNDSRNEQDEVNKNNSKQMNVISNDKLGIFQQRHVERERIMFTQNLSHDNHFYINHFLNYFLVEKKKKNNLELIYDKIYYYILIVSMCFKDKNLLALLLSKDEKFYDEFNQMIQEYLKYVLKYKEEVNKKKKKNEVMIQNLLYIFVSYIYIYLNELYNIFFTQVKNVLTLPSFFQNIIYVKSKQMDIVKEKKSTIPIRADDTLVDTFYQTLINMKKRNWNKNLENYTDQNIKNVVLRNIFHNNNIYLFILYIINDNKYTTKNENKKKNDNILLNQTLSKDYKDIHRNDTLAYFQLHFKKNDKTFLNKITTNIILFFLLFFYDYYSFNYEIKENILMQIARHILEHLTTFYNSDLLNIHLKFVQMIKKNNLKKKKTHFNEEHPPYGLNQCLKNMTKESQSQDTLTQCTKNEFTKSIQEKINDSPPSKNKKCSRAIMALARIREEGRKKRERGKAGEVKSGEVKSGEVKSGEVKSGEVKGSEVNGRKVKGVKANCGEEKMGRAKINKDVHNEAAEEVYKNSPNAKPPIDSKNKPEESEQTTQSDAHIMSTTIEKLRKNKKLLFLYTINCFRIIQIYNNISSLIFKYKYISTLLKKIAYLVNTHIVESVWNSFNLYMNNNMKNEINILNENSMPHINKEIGYLSYMYINYFFNFLSCFIIYDVFTLYKFCSNTLNCLDILNNYLKELMEHKKGTYLCSVILKFYLIITNSYFFDFSFYKNTLNVIEQAEDIYTTTTSGQNQMNIIKYATDNLKNRKRHDIGEITYFLCIKKLSNEFSKSKFLQFLINYIINKLDNNVNKSKVEIEQNNHLIVLILQLLSYQIIFIDNKNEILKLANVLVKYIKKKDPCLLKTYYIIIFFNSCFLNSSFDERIINLLFTFEKNENMWFNLIFLQNSKMKKSKEILLLIKFSILHLYLLLLKNKNSFKKCILCISSDLNIYFVFIYILNEIYEYFKSFNFEENTSLAMKIKKYENSTSEITYKKNNKKYFYLYAELLVMVTEMIKILNNNDINKYITIHHNKEKENLIMQFKNLYKKIKSELRNLDHLIKLIKCYIFIHPLMINIHILHKLYLCIYIKEYHYFHKEFFKYDLFLVDYLYLLRKKRKEKFSSSVKTQQDSEASIIREISVENSQNEIKDDDIINRKKKKDNTNISEYEINEKQKNLKKTETQQSNNFEKHNMHFYFFFNSTKNYNNQANTLCSSILQNEFQHSLSKFFSSFFQNQNDNSETSLQYNNEEIKIYVDYIHDSVNYAIEFFSSF
ncbi:hypothetical protein, conserved [Plasmodium gonderi]|uniref:Uncharacterized protein n=1 Tax=Plasmodium gonderi TaxID=77519 RepID=A0A1Y1JMK5_PLAGO|nr:hypothetical protein, conserved [Plasmodium gonderi]GAW82705.1 hypothetical protein, conserved [Plasmodium gonderi]